MSHNMSSPVVQVTEGKLQGKTFTDYKGGQFYGFQGIPYAKPPIGDLRFKAPVPPEPWKGIRDATKEGNESVSRHLIFRTPVGSEDCLFLNIYTPTLPKDGELLPVMVFVHGGGFVKGSSKAELHGPEYLITGNVILVTLNYRLGILGFLSLEDTSLGVPGNAGLKDIVQALKWLQVNIQEFNGDPNNVTVFGESAGATAVHSLILSPMAKGLFHRGIMQSGCALNPWATGSRNVREIGKVLGCLSDSEKVILDFLRTVPEEMFIEAQDKIKDTMSPNKIRPFGFVIEKPSNEPAFMPEHPVDIMLSGNYNKVPIMLGYTSREGMLTEIAIKREYGFMRMFTDFETKVPFFYNAKKGSEDSLTIAQKIKEFYYEGNDPSIEKIDQFYLMETDILFLRGIFVSMRNHLKNIGKPMYLYRLSVESELNFYKKVGDIQHPGVCHADDLGYLFSNIISPDFKAESLEGKSVHRIIKFWTNFARSGDPNPKETDSIINVKWEPLQQDKYCCMDIGTNLKLGIIHEDLERMKFWDEISALPNLNSKL